MSVRDPYEAFADHTRARDHTFQRTARFLPVLEQLLKIEASEVKAALHQATHLVAEILEAEYVTIFLHDPLAAALVALGDSGTVPGKRLCALGLDRLPLLQGSYPVQGFLSGCGLLTGHLEREAGNLPGRTTPQGLGIRSEMVVALEVGGTRQGVLVASSCLPERFCQQDLRFLEAMARWIGVMIQRAALFEQAHCQQVQPLRILHLLLGKAPSSHLVVVGDLVLDRRTRQAWRSGQALALTRREYDLLALLVSNAGQVLTRECLWARVWGCESETGLDVLKVYINYLRAKLNAGGKPELIHTVRGVGYLLKA